MKLKIFLTTIIASILTIFIVNAIEISLPELKSLLNEENFGATVLFPSGGGTGTSTNPSSGYLLIGNSSGGYDFIASSSLISSSAGTINYGLLGQISYYSSNGTTLSGTSTIFVTNENVGIGTTTPLLTLDVYGTFGVSGATTFNGVSYTWPSSDGTSGYSLVTNGSGVLSWLDVSKASTSDTVVFNTIAGEPINKGQAVHIEFEVGGLPKVILADADDSSRMPALGLAATSVASGSALQIIQTGRLTGFDTSSYSAGDSLWIATSTGNLVNYRPYGITEQIQKMAQVENSSVTGDIIIFGAGRSNDVPNQFTVVNATTTNLSVSLNSSLGTIISGTWNGGVISSSYIQDAYLLNTGDIGTGVYDFGGATRFEIPNGSSVYTNTTGDIAIDTTSGQLRWNDGTATNTVMGFFYFKGTLLASSTDSLQGANATTTFELPRLFENFTITDIFCETDTGTSSLRVGDGTNWSELIFCDSDGSEDDGSISNGSFTSKETIQVQYLNSYTGKPFQTPLTIKYKYDAD